MDMMKQTLSTSSHGTNSRTYKERYKKRRNTQQKQKDEDDFEFPPLRKTARKTVLEQSSDITLDNQCSLLPNVVNKQVSGLQASPVARNTTLTPPTNPLPRQ
ncbi:hypothetical protein TNIN_81021 [Trichonephila inaurata madagascariensis]|uniref:Uncharacterized protein n=1 Tax=Trichonephila inaurata madagascariensis TaxID=2747483 RepID=A0A8X6X6G2_9ARAC|nr:hypothetical protein TNIN_81021 [Trichonephila inaurata madagascariensis]